MESEACLRFTNRTKMSGLNDWIFFNQFNFNQLDQSLNPTKNNLSQTLPVPLLGDYLLPACLQSSNTDV